MSAIHQHPTEELVQVPAGSGVELSADLAVPEIARGVVLFAHGSGSSRFSPRNQRVARQLHEAQLATLLLDLLTPEEQATDTRTAHLRFDMQLLSNRLVAATDWLLLHPSTLNLPIGYFGASTGAGAAMMAAARRANAVGAVVSRGGRPDLAGEALSNVRAPTLLIVGANDQIVLELNERAVRSLKCIKQLKIVPGATHLFEEPGALEEVAQLARDWFVRCLYSGDGGFMLCG